MIARLVSFVCTEPELARRLLVVDKRAAVLLAGNYRFPAANRGFEAGLGDMVARSYGLRRRWKLPSK